MKRNILFLIVAGSIFCASHAGAQLLSNGRGPGRMIHNPSPATQDIFINHMKSCHATNWTFTDSIAAIVNSNGYFQSPPPHTWSCLISIADTSTAALTPGYTQPDTWTFFWKGNAGTRGMTIQGLGSGNFCSDMPGATCTISGDASCAFNINTSTGAIDLSGGTVSAGCTLVFDEPASLSRGGIKICFNAGHGSCDAGGEAASGLSGISEIALYKTTEAALFASGELYEPTYIAYLNALNPRVLRFLNWTYNAGTNLSRWDQWLTLSSMGWELPVWQPSYWVGAGCNSSGGGAAYTATPPSSWAGLVDGAAIQCQVDVTNSTTTPTLNVGGTGAATIVNKNWGALTKGVLANFPQTFIYSKQQNLWAAASSSVLFTGHGSFVPAIPIQAIVALCNKLQKDCWIQIPAYFDIASTQAMATVVAQNLNKDLKAYFEYANELFGGINESSLYAIAQGVAMGLPSIGGSGKGKSQYGFAGLRSKQMFDAIAAIWPATAAKWYGVMTGQLGSTLGEMQTYKLSGKDLTFSAIDASANTATYCSGSPCTVMANYSRSPNRPVDSMPGGFIAVSAYVGPPNIGGGYAGPSYPTGACEQSFQQFTGNCPFTILDTTTATLVGISGSTVSVSTRGASLPWADGDRVELTGNFTTSPSFPSPGWTTILGWTNDGGGNYHFTLSGSTTDAGVTQADRGYGSFASTGVVHRVTPGINTALLNAAAQYAAGDIRGAFAWISSDFYSGRRSGQSTPASMTSILPYIANLANAASVTYASLGIHAVTYEDAFSAAPPSTANGLTLGWGSSATTNAQALFSAYVVSQALTNDMNRWYQLQLAQTGFLYPSQFNDLGGAGSVWTITQTNNPQNYLPPSSLTPFSAIQNLNAGRYPYLLRRDIDPAANDNGPAFLDDRAA